VLIRQAATIFSMFVFLTGCSQIELATHTAKKITTSVFEKSKGRYKVGKPYKIQGTWYYPAVNYSYLEKGVASWYGPKFHGKKTANGEIFDMNAVSAAHRTLPMPSIVRVTNLNNGRSLKLKVNDRGPFAKNRIIDLSRRAAQLLGFEREGTALVRVEIVADESRRFALLSQKDLKSYPAIASQKIEIVSLPGSPSAPQSLKIGNNQQPKNTIISAGSRPFRAKVKIVPVKAVKKIYVQAGAFVYPELAEKMRKLLEPVGPTRIIEAIIGKRRYFRVQVGPAGSVREGDKLLNLVIASGYPKARLVVD